MIVYGKLANQHQAKQTAAWEPLKQQRQPSDPRPRPPGLLQVPAHPCLVSHRFSSNSIGDGGAQALAEALKVNQGLESLE